MCVQKCIYDNSEIETCCIYTLIPIKYDWAKLESIVFTAFYSNSFQSEILFIIGHTPTCMVKCLIKQGTRRSGNIDGLKSTWYNPTQSVAMVIRNFELHPPLQIKKYNKHKRITGRGVDDFLNLLITQSLTFEIKKNSDNDQNFWRGWTELLITK